MNNDYTQNTVKIISDNKYHNKYHKTENDWNQSTYLLNLSIHKDFRK